MRDSQKIKIVSKRRSYKRHNASFESISSQKSTSCWKWIFLSICYLLFFILIFLLFQFHFITIENPDQILSTSTADIDIRTPSILTSKFPASLPNPPQQSKFAYTTLISGIDKSFKYRGFLYNALIMRRALLDSGSTADFIAMIGFSDSDHESFEEDLNLLRSHGISTYILPRFVEDQHKLSFAEMALLKITPWSFTQYDRVQFFDGDIMPLQNMDCFFSLSSNAFTVGAVSPLNSGWFLAIPNQKIYEEMKEKAIWRLGRDWDVENGWKERLPSGLTVRGGKKEVKVWDFNGADMDQGLFTHYFVLNHGNVLLIDTDTRKVREFEAESGLLGGSELNININNALSSCQGKEPTRFFAHFTGRSKPWMVDLSQVNPEKGSSNLARWAKHLNDLKLPINSQNISKLELGSPLGFWNAKFPKGGYKV